MPHLTRRDPVGIALRWETAAGGTLTDTHPLASKAVDLATALDGLAVRLQGPQGSSVTLQGRFDKESKGATGKLSREPSIVPVRVQAVVRSYTERTLELRPGLRVTQDHPIWSGDRWSPAGSLQAGSPVLDGERGSLALASGPAAAPASEVIDLTVDGPHNFFAGGLLVHNKMGANPVWQRLHQGSWGTYEMRPGEAP